MVIRKALWYLSSSVKLPARRTSFAFNSLLTELRALYHIQSELAVSAWKRMKGITSISQGGTWGEFRTGLQRRSVLTHIACIRILDSKSPVHKLSMDMFSLLRTDSGFSCFRPSSSVSIPKWILPPTHPKSIMIRASCVDSPFFSFSLADQNRQKHIQ